jgi:hypothetical protein
MSNANNASNANNERKTDEQQKPAAGNSGKVPNADMQPEDTGTADSGTAHSGTASRDGDPRTAMKQTSKTAAESGSKR